MLLELQEHTGCTHCPGETVLNFFLTPISPSPMQLHAAPSGPPCCSLWSCLCHHRSELSTAHPLPVRSCSPPCSLTRPFLLMSWWQIQLPLVDYSSICTKKFPKSLYGLPSQCHADLWSVRMVEITSVWDSVSGRHLLVCRTPHALLSQCEVIINTLLLFSNPF